MNSEDFQDRVIIISDKISILLSEELNEDIALELHDQVEKLVAEGLHMQADEEPDENEELTDPF